jgi:hypothetical protein
MNNPLHYAQSIAYSSKEVLQFSYEMGLKYKDTPGIFVETGVAAGAQVIAMAYGAPNKTIYAFDSFCGLPWPSNKDNQMPGIRMLTKEEQQSLPDPGKQVLESSGATSVPLEDFKNHIRAAGLKNPHFIKPIRGWFEETVQHCNRDIALLRLDGDLYNSTYVCLKYLYPKVIKGGLVIIDDWALPGCRQAVADYLNEMDLDTPWFQFIADENSIVAFWTKS